MNILKEYKVNNGLSLPARFVFKNGEELRMVRDLKEAKEKGFNKHNPDHEFYEGYCCGGCDSYYP